MADFAVVNAEDANARAAAADADSSLFLFSSKQQMEQGAFLDRGELFINWKGQELRVVSLEDVKLKGQHNVENILAAVSAAFLLGLSADSAAEAVRAFSGVEHRLEWVRRHRGVDYYNDSKATNVDSAIRAIQAFDQPLVLIMGGLDKGTDFTPLRTVISQNVRKVILLGKASKKLASVLGDLIRVEEAASLEEAVLLASYSALPRHIVLLAPACASFDMFEDYEDRGRKFKELVHSLKPIEREEECIR